jgi:hypothetical protein
MFEIEVDTLDADETLTHASGLRALADRAEVGVIETAAQWAALHGVVDNPTGASLPGMERLVRLGGDGTPKVAEFAPAELGAELGISPYAAQVLVADALDLRHRLPLLWGRVQAGEVKAWVARKIAQATRDHDTHVAAAVDAKVAKWADRLGWARLDRMVDAAIIAADPATAEAEAERRRSQHGVWLSRSTDHETRTAFIRGDAVAMTYFDASLDRIADAIGLLGDTTSKDVRRATAIGILSHPQRTLDLYDRIAAAAQTMEPASLPADVTGSRGLVAADRYGADDPGTDRDTLPSDPDSHPPVVRTGGRRVDPRPPATLYVHLSHEALTTGAGVARVEDVGPVTVDQVRRWLGHCHATVKPVLDPLHTAPVDSYEIPDRLREAVHLMTPTDVFPFATSTTATGDIDHTIPYLPPAKGGPPGQTRIGNLGPFARFHHRVKTHGRWQVKQPYPGIYIWKSPHHRYFIVDHTGTRKLGDTAA